MDIDAIVVEARRKRTSLEVLFYAEGSQETQRGITLDWQREQDSIEELDQEQVVLLTRLKEILRSEKRSRLSSSSSLLLLLLVIIKDYVGAFDGVTAAHCRGLWCEIEAKCASHHKMAPKPCHGMASRSIPAGV